MSGGGEQGWDPSDSPLGEGQRSIFVVWEGAQSSQGSLEGDGRPADQGRVGEGERGLEGRA